MNQTLINKYKISFSYKLQSFESGKAEYFPVAETSSSHLTDFLLTWSSSDEIEKHLIPEIEKIRNGFISEFETGTETTSVTIGINTTIFYYGNKPEEYPQIPTQDLTDILLEWKNFLERPFNYNNLSPSAS